MNEAPLISIVTPCFNGAQHLSRFLDSVLAQTYTALELVFVNDGSTDNTGQIVNSYIPAFENHGIKLVYITQENQGLGGAINAGLQRVTGKYICWPDADDYLEPASVELRVKILEENPEYAVVTSDAYVRRENDPTDKFYLVSSSYKTNHDPFQFFHMLNGETIFCAGSHMVRSDIFFETHPGKRIYPARKGQNYQMLLPIYYRHKRYFLDKPLYNYIKHGTSMSNINNSDLEEIISRDNHHREIILETLSSIYMSKSEMELCSGIIKARFSFIAFKLARTHADFDMLKTEYRNLKNLKRASARIKLQYFLTAAAHFAGLIRRTFWCTDK
jgi:glycosyltransferase involved in cell wall biosynthesis